MTDVSVDAALRAQAMLELNRPAEAERALRELLTEDPSNAWAQCTLARALMLLERRAEAVAAARKAVELDPEDDYALYVLAVALALDSKLGPAENAIRAAIERDPLYAPYHETLSSILLQRERPAEAAEAAARARELTPMDPGTIATHGQALATLGRSDDAERAAREALAIDAEDVQAHVVLGQVALNRGQSDEAIAHFREALRLDPTSDTAREGLVVALKSRWRIYGYLLRFSFWQQRLPGWAKWGITLSPLMAGRIAVATGAWPLLIAALLFVALMWTIDPLLTLLLMGSKTGRHVVGPHKRGPLLFGVFLVAAIGVFALAAVWNSLFVGTSFGLAFFAFAAGKFDLLAGRHRRVFEFAAVTVPFVVLAQAALIAAGFTGVVFGAIMFLGGIAATWYVTIVT